MTPVNVGPLQEEALALQLDLISRQVQANIEHYGFQNLPILLTCMTEELGEVAREMKRLWSADTPEPLERIGNEARDLAALCIQMGLLVDNLRHGPGWVLLKWEDR